jgi:hypothetical protein
LSNIFVESGLCPIVRRLFSTPMKYIYFICIIISFLIEGCAYTILKENELSESEHLAAKQQLEEKKLSPILVSAIKKYERFDSEPSKLSDSLYMFRDPYDFHLDQEGRIYLNVIGDYKRDDIPDSLLAIGSIIDKVNIISFAQPQYTIWVPIYLVRRVASWHFIEGIVPIEKLRRKTGIQR